MKRRSRSRWIGCWAGVLLFGARQALAAGATISVTFGVYVPLSVRWVGPNAASFVLEKDGESSRTFRLALNGDVLLTARLTPFTNVVNPLDRLEAEWKIEDDGDRQGRSGIGEGGTARGVGTFVSERDFLRGGVRVLHRPGDGDVRFRVTARTTSKPFAGRYEATLVLTALPLTTRRSL